MVFSSLPPYLVDPPNWQHQQSLYSQQSGGVYGGGEVHEGSQLTPPPADAVAAGGGVGGAAAAVAAKPGSMSERARQLKIPLPETALKCPRCESTNTKFCYFNNYSLSQPRHFCKTCRRYWTRGGALRSVPVGGGCRRNKKSSKGSKNRSKSPATTSSTSTTTASAAVLSPQSAQLQLPFLPSLHHLGEYGGWDTFGGGNEISSSSGKLLQQVQQFPFSNMGNGINNYHQLEGEDGLGNYVGVGTPIDQFGSKTLDCGVGGIMKIEELNLSRNFLGISGNNQFNWGTSNVGTWSNSTDHNLSGFASSSTSHLF